MSGGSIVFLGSYLKKYKFKLSLVFLALLLSAGSVLSIGVAVRYFVNEGVGGNGADINKISAVLGGILLLLAAASASRSYLISEICENVAVDVKKDVYKKLLHTSIAYFEKNNVTDIVSRLVNDTQFIQNVITSVFSFFLRNIIMLVGGVTLLFITNSVLTFYVIASIPAVILPIVFLSKKVKIASKDSQSNLSKIAAHIEETLSGIKTVHLNNAESFEEMQMDTVSRDYLKSVMNKSLKRSTLVALVMGISSISILSVLWVGTGYVLEGIMTSGDLVSFIFYSIVVASSMGGMSEVVSDVNKASGAAERIIELYSTEKANQNLVGEKLSEEKSEIEFNKVSFCYPTRPDKQVLSNVSFVVNQGNRVILAGKSGSGKTTMIDLLLKFYRPKAGQILIGGRDIQDVSASEIRELIGVVSQETLIFSNTVLFNIAYGKPGCTKEEVVSAAKIANIHDFIMSLPEQYETSLGEKGVQLSGGQRQRISIARAVLKDPKILILDEATSNLDEDNAEMVYNALDLLMKGRTVLIISHRSHFFNSCDKVLSLSGGEIKEMERI